MNGHPEIADERRVRICEMALAQEPGTIAVYISGNPKREFPMREDDAALYICRQDTAEDV